MRRRAFVTALAMVVLSWPDDALAKGPSSATIAGEGLEHPVEAAGLEGGGGDFAALVDQTGFFPAIFVQTPDPMLDRAPSGELGPQLVVTWRLPFEEGRTDFVVQELYPYATAGPLTYTAPGQRFFGGEQSHGGWYRASVELVATLERLGAAPEERDGDGAIVPAVNAVAPAGGSEATGAPRSGGGGDDGGAWWLAPMAALSVVALGTAGVVVRSARRRVRVSPT
jgi:hypothetical protein